MAYGAVRFLYNNFVTSVDMITADTQATGRGQQMELVAGSGSAIPISYVAYTGTVDRTIYVVIDSVTAGVSIGQATYRWRYDDSSGWEATGVTTSATLTTLGLGIKIAWVAHPTGDDFALDDSFQFRVRATLGVQNLLDGDPNTLFQSTAVDNLVFDLGSAQNVTAFALMNHNFVASQSTFKLQANSSDSWSSPPYDNSITVTNTYQIEYLDETYRYWRTDPTDGALSEVSIGELFLGEYLELTKNAWWGTQEGLGYIGSAQESQWGIRRQQGSGQRRIYTLQYDHMRDTDIDALITMQAALYNTTTGKVSPLFLHLISDDGGETLILAHWANWESFQRTHLGPNLRAIPNLVFQEVPITPV